MLQCKPLDDTSIIRFMVITESFLFLPYERDLQFLPSPSGSLASLRIVAYLVRQRQKEVVK